MNGGKEEVFNKKDFSFRVTIVPPVFVGGHHIQAKKGRKISFLPLALAINLSSGIGYEV